MTLLTAEEVVPALLQGKDIQYNHNEFGWSNLDPSSFYLIHVLNKNMQFRLTPEDSIITIKGISFTKPYKGDIDYGTLYYIPDVTQHNLFWESEWTDTLVDAERMYRGVLHLSKESAIEHAKALIKLSTGDIDV